MRSMKLLVSIFYLAFLLIPQILNAQSERFKDNGDGTVTDSKTGLIWEQKCSYANLEKGLNWNKAKEYVQKLRVGGYADWRMPTIEELQSLYIKDLDASCLVPGYRTSYPVVFAEGALWYWSNEETRTCCARKMYFNNGFVFDSQKTDSSFGGVRAVRRTRK